MRTVSLSVLIFAISLLCVQTRTPQEEARINLLPCVAMQWGPCSVNIATAIFLRIAGLFGWSNDQKVPAFGGTCNGRFKGGFHQWQWKWDGEFRCPHVSSTVVGVSFKSKARDTAIRRSMEDFIEKAGASGALTQQHIDSYDKDYLVTTTTISTTSNRKITYITGKNRSSQKLSANFKIGIILILLLFFAKNF